MPDYSNLKDVNRNVTQQWEDAVEAMSKRDTALQHSQESNAKLRQQVIDTTLEARKLRQDIQVSTKKNNNSEKGIYDPNALIDR